MQELSLLLDRCVEGSLQHELVERRQVAGASERGLRGLDLALIRRELLCKARVERP